MLSEQEVERLRAAVERDVDVVVRACWPREWSNEPAPIEPHLVCGCYHPATMLALSRDANLKITVQCAACGTDIDNELVAIRLKDYQA